MPGSPVTIGCAVTLTYNAPLPPDIGIITMIPQAVVQAGGLPLATVGAICQMVNSVSGAPYPLPIPPLGGSGSLTVDHLALVRMGDVFTLPIGTLAILGPPAAAFVTDQGSP